MLLVGNGMLITRDNDNPWFQDGAVVIDGDTIKEAVNMMLAYCSDELTVCKLACPL